MSYAQFFGIISGTFLFLAIVPDATYRLVLWIAGRIR